MTKMIDDLLGGLLTIITQTIVAPILITALAIAAIEHALSADFPGWTWKAIWALNIAIWTLLYLAQLTSGWGKQKQAKR